jgi:hypothetical protein
VIPYRGPFRLCVTRPASKPGFYRSEWLAGTVATEDLTAEARALLTDPRDRIQHINVWSEREQKFVHTFRREDFDESSQLGR